MGAVTEQDVSTDVSRHSGMLVCSALVTDGVTGFSWWERVAFDDYGNDDAIEAFVDHCREQGYRKGEN